MPVTFEETRAQRLPFMEEAARVLGITRFSLRRICSGKSRNPAAVAGYRDFAQKRIAEMTGGDDAVQGAELSSALRRAKKEGQC